MSDHLGTPSNAAKVEVLGTSLSALTTEDGSYQLPYVPGKVSIRYTKDGYLPVRREYDIAVSTSFPASPVVFYPYVPGAPLTALTNDGPVAVPLVELQKSENSKTYGLRYVPSFSLPAESWGFVWVPSEVEGEDSRRQVSKLEIMKAAWRDTEQIRGWRGYSTVPLECWVASQEISAEQFPADPLLAQAAVLRPGASFDDGLYFVRVKGDGQYVWAFTVGKVEEEGAVNAD